MANALLNVLQNYTNKLKGSNNPNQYSPSNNPDFLTAIGGKKTFNIQNPKVFGALSNMFPAIRGVVGNGQVQDPQLIQYANTLRGGGKLNSAQSAYTKHAVNSYLLKPVMGMVAPEEVNSIAPDPAGVARENSFYNNAVKKGSTSSLIDTGNNAKLAKTAPNEIDALINRVLSGHFK